MTRVLFVGGLVLLSGCYPYAGIAAAPDGTVWIAKNATGLFTAASDSVYHCTPQAAREGHAPGLDCVKVDVRERDR